MSKSAEAAVQLMVCGVPTPIPVATTIAVGAPRSARRVPPNMRFVPVADAGASRFLTPRRPHFLMRVCGLDTVVATVTDRATHAATIHHANGDVEPMRPGQQYSLVANDTIRVAAFQLAVVPAGSHAPKGGSPPLLPVGVMLTSSASTASSTSLSSAAEPASAVVGSPDTPASATAATATATTAATTAVAPIPPTLPAAALPSAILSAGAGGSATAPSSSSSASSPSSSFATVAPDMVTSTSVVPASRRFVRLVHSYSPPSSHRSFSTESLASRGFPFGGCPLSAVAEEFVEFGTSKPRAASTETSSFSPPLCFAALRPTQGGDAADADCKSGHCVRPLVPHSEPYGR